MSLVVSSLNSGSNGNCYYAGNNNEAVLIDAGLTCRETEKRMKRLGLPMGKVKAIFISHGHGDHIRGLEVLSRKYQLPVFITPATLQHSRLHLDKELINTFSAYQPICIGALSVHPFPKLHDAADPYSFIIKDKGVTVGVFTDIGSPCEHVINNFKQCHAVFLEANYDEGMLENGRYPLHVKRRISGTHGHLSNRQALELFLAHRPAFMSHLFLSHLSKDNNDPDLALGLFASHRENMHIAVASRYEEMAIHHISDTNGNGGRIQQDQLPKYVQTSLF